MLSRDHHHNTLFCADKLLSGATLFWSIGVNQQAGTQRYSAAVISEESLETGKPSTFSLETKNGPVQIVQSQISVSGGEINLWFSGFGELGLVQLRRFPDQLNEFCQIDWNLLTGKFEAVVPSEWTYNHGTSGMEIRRIDDQLELGIYPVSDNKFQVASDGWKQKWWTVQKKPISLGDQVVLSPQRWGNSAEAERVARAVEKIITERVRPVGV